MTVLSIVLSLPPRSTPCERSESRCDVLFSSSHMGYLARHALRSPDQGFYVLSPLTPKGGHPTLRGRVLPRVGECSSGGPEPLASSGISSAPAGRLPCSAAKSADIALTRAQSRRSDARHLISGQVVSRSQGPRRGGAIHSLPRNDNAPTCDDARRLRFASRHVPPLGAFALVSLRGVEVLALDRRGACLALSRTARPRNFSHHGQPPAVDAQHTGAWVSSVAERAGRPGPVPPSSGAGPRRSKSHRSPGPRPVGARRGSMSLASAEPPGRPSPGASGPTREESSDAA
jgi:hypothetical protein